MSRFGVALDAGDALVGRFLPQELPRPLVEAQHSEALGSLALDGLDVAVQPHSKPGVALAAHRGGDEDPIAPHDGRGVSETGDGDPEQDVSSVLDAPIGGSLPSLSDPARLGAAELGPVLRLREPRNEKENERHRLRHRESPGGTIAARAAGGKRRLLGRATAEGLAGADRRAML